MPERDVDHEQTLREPIGKGRASLRHREVPIVIGGEIALPGDFPVDHGLPSPSGIALMRSKS